MPPRRTHSFTRSSTTSTSKPVSSRTKLPHASAVPASKKTSAEFLRDGTPRHRSSKTFLNSFPSLPSRPGQVFVFGAGTMGELGLGPTSHDRNVKRPRLNPHLPL